MANKFPCKSQSQRAHPRKEEGQDSFHPLQEFHQILDLLKGGEEKRQLSKRSILLKEAFTILLPKSTRWGTRFSKLDLGSGMWNQSVLLP